MTTNTCVRDACGRPTPDGVACPACMQRTREHLATIGELLPVALDVAYGQTARTQTGGSGGGEPRLELNLTAKARLDAVGNALTTWARAIAEERGVQVPGGDPIMAASAWLSAHCEWMRHRAEVDEFMRDVAECAAVMRGIAAGPRERVFLGPCGAPVPQPPEGEPGLPCCVATCCEPHGGDCCSHDDPVDCPADPYVLDVPCDTPLYGQLGASKATCRTCGAEHNPDQRIRERQDLAHSYTYTAAEIEHAYGGVILASTIRQWRKRGLLPVHGEADGKRLYAIGEVLTLVATTKERQRRTAEMGA